MHLHINNITYTFLTKSQSIKKWTASFSEIVTWDWTNTVPAARIFLPFLKEKWFIQSETETIIFFFKLNFNYFLKQAPMPAPAKYFSGVGQKVQPLLVCWHCHDIIHWPLPLLFCTQFVVTSFFIGDRSKKRLFIQKNSFKATDEHYLFNLRFNLRDLGPNYYNSCPYYSHSEPLSPSIKT